MIEVAMTRTAQRRDEDAAFPETTSFLCARILKSELRCDELKPILSLEPNEHVNYTTRMTKCNTR